ncbi:MAG TPA: UDP-N-acetylglucosamine--N-acetylmuramyl-(pentapeptide) pyrophosphoryl-undecaprenol N-acetylglucosamine transferase [Candidatus Acidoferrales bacterium]|nr:UDP-N-acetylglucosamine--N-acetylmuramyl-(pentapeptide) pyrophosphoryl-undecaprenol N-acetylglucosamine transferase [Candidatus Acidoferrales bacterium]
MKAFARRIAIAAGGTAGHINPGLAFAEAYRAAQPDVELLFIGTAQGLESRLITETSYRLQMIPGRPFYGITPKSWLRATAALAAGIVRARRWLRDQRIDLVVGFGGYASAGAVLAAGSLGVPCAIHEGNGRPGRANRLLGYVVDRVYLSFPVAARAFPADKTYVVGTPVSSRLRCIGETRVAPQNSGRSVHLLVTGGTLGSALLNRALPEVVALMSKGGVELSVRHQVGDVCRVPWAQQDARFAAGDVDQVRAAYAAAGVSASVVPFIEDMTDAYAWADVAVSCAGATLAELAASALPSIIVPMSAAADDHQRFNAEAFAELTGLWWCTEADWKTDVVAMHLSKLCTDEKLWKETSQRLLRNASMAASEIVADCEAWLASRS